MVRKESKMVASPSPPVLSTFEKKTPCLAYYPLEYRRKPSMRWLRCARLDLPPPVGLTSPKPSVDFEKVHAGPALVL